MVLLSHTDFSKGVVMVCEGCQSVPIPITSLYQLCVRMVGLASTSTLPDQVTNEDETVESSVAGGSMAESLCVRHYS